jgi:hypothetical protein
LTYANKSDAHIAKKDVKHCSKPDIARHLPLSNSRPIQASTIKLIPFKKLLLNG